MVDKIGYSRPIGPSKRTSKTKKTSGASAGAFADALSSASGADGLSEIDAPQASAPVNNIGSLLSAQEISEEEIARQKLVKHGQMTLDMLEKVRDGLLSGSLPASTIKQLETMIRQERQFNRDPRLAEIIDEIEVRASVELAKLEMSGLL